MDMNAPNGRRICVHESVKPIELEYSDSGTYYGDTTIKIYEEYKISLVLTDDCGAVIGSKVFFPQRGDLIIFRPNEVHFGRFPRSGEYRFVSFLFPVDLFEHVCRDSRSIVEPFLDDSADKVNLIRLPEPYKSRVIDLTEGLLQRMKEETPHVDALAFAALIEALHVCCQFYPGQKAKGDTHPPHPVVARALRHINADFPAFMGLEELAKCCGCSVTYLTQIFRRYTGKTVHGYLTETRLEHARQLLRKGISVTETAYRSGYDDTSRFILQFKKQFHMTPGQYKKQ